MFAYANTNSIDISANNPLDIRRAIATSMEPVLRKNNFIFSRCENTTYIYHHVNNPEISVTFTVNSSTRCIRCDLQRGNKNDLMANYPLSLFVQGNSCFKGIKNDGFWYFNSDEEFLAILEEQAELLVQFGFQWMFDHLKVELEEC